MNNTIIFLQLANARAPLQAKIEDMEDAMQHLQDKFNKVKAENERVCCLIFSLQDLCKNKSKQEKIIYRSLSLE